MLARLLAVTVLASIVLAACGGSDGPQNTPPTVGRGPALQTFLRQAYESGWFAEGDPVDVEIVETFYEPAAARAAEYGLGLYATAPGTPPYTDGLPGYLITAIGEFYDYEGDDRPPPETPRRPAVAAGYVDTAGRFTYTFRYLDEVEKRALEELAQQDAGN
jgi:ABC-type nitrate/sulfonate/bicarbonate transport system substrate-binding protein